MPAVAEAELWIFMCNFLSSAVLDPPALPRGKPHPPILELLRFTCLEQRGWRQNLSFYRWVMAINISPLHWHVADSLECTDPWCALFLSGLPSFVCSKCWGGQFSKAEFSAGFLCLVCCFFFFLLQHRVLVKYHFYSKIWVQFEFLLILTGIRAFKSLLFGCFSIAWVFILFFI